MTTMSRTEAHQAMLRHHALLGEQVAQRVGAVHGAVDEAGGGVPGGTGYEPAAAELVAFMGDEVLPHAVAEEQSIYAVAAARAALTGVVAQMLEEHRRLVALTEDLASANTAAVMQDKSAQIAELFAIHVSKENDLLLPPLFADEDVDVVDLLAQMHRLTEAVQEGTQTGLRASASSLDDALLSLLLGAADELAQAGEAERACQLAAAAWAKLRDPRPDLAVRVTAALHRLARMATEEPVVFRTEPTVGDEQAEPALDVRPLAPARRHETIFTAYGQLAPGAGFVLVNDHDPKPLQYQFEAEHRGQFTWDYLEAGPRTWRVRIGRTEQESLQ